MARRSAYGSEKSSESFFIIAVFYPALIKSLMQEDRADDFRLDRARYSERFYSTDHETDRQNCRHRCDRSALVT